MTVRTVRQILNALTAACAVGIGCVVLWAMTKPALPEPDAPPVRQPTNTGEATDGSLVTDQQMAAVWNRPLQKALRDATKVRRQPKTPVKTNRTPPAFNPRVELLATVIDPVKTLAIIVDARGRTDLKGVGETLQLMPSGLKVEDIKPGEVTLSMGGRSVRLKLKNAPGGSAVGTTGRKNGRRNANRNAKRSAAEYVDDGLGPDMSGPPPGPQGEPPPGMMKR